MICDMGKIAYMISAYKDAAHLKRLIDALDFDADFFVHVDGNVDIQPFLKAVGNRAKFVGRHRVSWGGWSQVEFQEELMNTVVDSGVGYDRVVCLSGLDYPLWGNIKIHQYFSQHSNEEFIMGMKLEDSMNPRQMAKVVQYHPFRDLTWSNLWLKNKVIVASRTLMKLLPLRKKPTVQVGGKDGSVYFGADYWALTLPCVKYVCNELKTNHALREYFKTSFIPSELCVQTIVFNSPFAPKAMKMAGPYKGLWALTPLHYINYGGGYIKILTEEDWPILQKSGKMFCRKIATGISDALAGKIDKERDGK